MIFRTGSKIPDIGPDIGQGNIWRKFPFGSKRQKSLLVTDAGYSFTSDMHHRVRENTCILLQGVFFVAMEVS